MSINEFREQRSEYCRRKEEVDKKLEGMNSIMAALKTSNIQKDDLKKKAKKIIAKIQSNLPEKQSEFKRIVKSIDGRQHQFSDDVGGSLRGSIQGDFFNFKDYNDSKELSDIRRRELEHIKETSAQVASLSDEMKNHIEKQEETFNAIEDNVHNVYMNVDKGGNDITKMEQVRSNHNRKIVFLIFACLTLLLFVTYLIYKMIS